MIDFLKAKKIHFVGIKGAGMAALAQVLKYQGLAVCGSDGAEEFFTDVVLKSRNIPVEPFSATHIAKGFDVIIYSTGYGQDHEEIRAAHDLGIPLISYPEAVGRLFNNAHGIAVCGTHGKTTITALTAWIYDALGLDPTALIGSTIQGTGNNAYTGRSKYWILEADEYQNKFEHYNPKAIIVSTIEYDHPDFFTDERAYAQTFKTFLANPSCELVVAGADDTGVQALIKELYIPRLVTYGFDESSDYRITDVTEDHKGFSFGVKNKGVSLGTFHTPLVGRHNIANACAVIALVHAQNLNPIEKVAEALTSFQGTGRRFETIGMLGNTIVIDDYAHHPAEIRATLQGACARYPRKRIVCCFGPHTYTRTHALFDDFARSFRDCDQVLLLDIYASARETKGPVHSKDLADAISAHSHNALYTGSIPHTIAIVRERIHDIDILITMGAGDVWKVGRYLLEDIHFAPDGQ
ncbi:UDP-N-acetylmuramate--L-alanine ligase [Candidatus Uhrbacteria bacterium]|nr:UDP-N-acetylmuramate--L-alanine ligase [Candidatus Uhrbacteria bacterium]